MQQGGLFKKPMGVDIAQGQGHVLDQTRES